MTSAVSSHRFGAAAAVLITVLLAVSCVIENPVLDSADTDTDLVTQAGDPTAIPQVEPTAPPSPPTPQPTVAPPPTVEPIAPTPAPEPTPEPSSTDVPPRADAPLPLPTVTEDSEFQPTIVEAGLIAIPVLNTTFRLDAPRPILQLGGHTLVYVDDQAGAEVDIFTPVALDDGTLIETYDQVIAFFEADALVDLEEAESVTIAGHSTRVFQGVGLERARAFVTHADELKNINLGWVVPDQIKLWVVDHPQGTVVVTAESLNDSNQFDEALELAADILSTIDFG